MNNERDKAQREFNKRGEEIAKFLNANYQAPSGEVWIPRGYITLATGERMHLEVNTHENRLCVSASWPIDGKNQVHYPRAYEKTTYTAIRMSLDKSPEKMAKEITSRFLPGFLPEYARQRAAAHNADAYVASTKSGIARLAKAYGTNAPGGDATGFSFTRGDYYGGVECYGAKAEIKLRGLTLEQAEQILKIVSKMP